jgi:hypothetical protein
MWEDYTWSENSWDANAWDDIGQGGEGPSEPESSDFSIIRDVTQDTIDNNTRNVTR